MFEKKDEKENTEKKSLITPTPQKQHPNEAANIQEESNKNTPIVSTHNSIPEDNEHKEKSPMNTEPIEAKDPESHENPIQFPKKLENPSPIPLIEDKKTILSSKSKKEDVNDPAVEKKLDDTQSEMIPPEIAFNLNKNQTKHLVQSVDEKLGDNYGYKIIPPPMEIRNTINISPAKYEKTAFAKCKNNHTEISNSSIAEGDR